MRKAGFLLALLFLGVCCAAPASADIEFGKIGEAFDSFTIGGEIDLFYRYDSNPWFGSKAAWDDDTTSYGEIFSRLRVTAAKNIGWTTLSGQLAGYFADTIGKDFYGLYDNEQQTGLDQAWLKFAKIGGTPVDLTLGRQDIKLEKWFVIADGEDQGAANWLYYHSSFPFAARLDGEFGAFKGTLFYAMAGDYVKDWTDLASRDYDPEDNVSVYGVNLHYDFTENMFVYGGVFQKNEDDEPDSMLENDTLTYDLGFDVTFAGLQLEAEGTLQRGDTGMSGVDRDAYAYFGSATYRFDVAMAPYLRAMYVFFSGDDPDTRDWEEYDPMFFDFQSWNRWIIGELVGEAQLPNQNKKNLILEAGFSPIEPMVASLMYIQHRLDDENSAGLSSDDWADEWNLFVDYPISDNLFASLGLGYVTPGDAAEEALGDDDAFFTQLFLNFSF